MTTIKVVANGTVSTGEAAQTIPATIDLESLTESISKVDGLARFKYKLDSPLEIDEKQADGSVKTKPKHFITSKIKQTSKEVIISEWVILNEKTNVMQSFFTI